MNICETPAMGQRYITRRSFTAALAAAPLALGDVDELMEEQFAVLPAIGANNDAVANGNATGGVGNDLGMAGGVRQLFIVR